MNIIAYLKDRPEINLSALGRAAGIKGNRLPQAVKGIEYETAGKMYARKLTDDELERVKNALRALRDSLNVAFATF